MDFADAMAPCSSSTPPQIGMAQARHCTCADPSSSSHHKFAVCPYVCKSITSLEGSYKSPDLCALGCLTLAN